jgi:hypothetical protein
MMQWGRLGGLNWISEISTRGSLNRAVAEVEVTEDLYGLRVHALTGHGDGISISLRDNDQDLAESLAAYVRGAGVAGKRLSAIASLLAPVDASALRSARSSDRAALSLAVSRYRNLRSEIDTRIEAAI